MTANASSTRSDYSRQIALRDIGEQGQQRLLAARVLVVGAGGLGVPVLSYLAGAGIGELGIVDHDVLDPSNLHRQPIYSLADVGRYKTHLAAARVRALNPEVKVRMHTQRICADNVLALLDPYDIVVDCTDNFATKFLINDAALLASKTAVFASVYQYEGQLQVLRPGEHGSSCLRCLWPEATPDGLVGSCQEAGVLGPVPGVLGSLQALEVLKICLDLPGQLFSEILLFDLLTLSCQRINAPRCAECRRGNCCRIPAAVQQDAEESSAELSFGDLQEAINAGYLLLDIRDAEEVAAEPIYAAAPCLQVPLACLLENPNLDLSRKYLLMCARGVRSRAAVMQLRRSGFRFAYSLKGGLSRSAENNT